MMNHPEEMFIGKTADISQEVVADTR